MVYIVKTINNWRALLIEMTGIVMVLKKKGLVFDDEIAQAITDSRKKYIEKDCVQPKEAGENEDSV
jgi:hypothetical protein